MKTSEEVSRRAGRVAGRAWWGVVALTAIVTALTFRIQPQGKEKLGFVFPVLAGAGIAGVIFELRNTMSAKRSSLRVLIWQAC